MSQTQQMIVIGAGIGGLTAAIHLAVQGHHVRVLERQSQVGGKLNNITLDGFSFDTGPSLITMPSVLQDLFQVAGRRLEDYLDLVPLDITCRYFYRDGLILNAWRDHARLAAEFARLNLHDGEALWRFLHYGQTLFEAAADPFLYSSFGSPFDVFRTFVRYVLHGHASSPIVHRSTWFTRLRAVLATLSPATLDQCVRTFFKDEHLCQIFDRYATYNGSSPYQISSVYSLIPYVEMADGGWYPRGGIYRLARALERVAGELGVCIETQCHVRRVLVARGRASGVVLDDGRVIHADAVVANSDVVTTYHDLLSPASSRKRSLQHLERLEPSCSGFVMLLGIKKRYPQLAHHNIFFCDNYHAEFEDLFVYRRLVRNPTIYICATTRTDPRQAPANCENLFVLVNAPYLTVESDWKRDAPAYGEFILDQLASYQQIDLTDLRPSIMCKAILTPEDFKQIYGANAGSIYGLSSNARMAPFTRPGNRSKDIRGLYFVGGSTHPGGGVPLVMLSGKIVADLVGEDLA